MPDLTIEHFYYCDSVENFTYKIEGKPYTVKHGPTAFGSYNYDWSCDCKSFQYRHRCKHIEEAKQHFCGWNQFTDGGQPRDGLCPKCLRKTHVSLVGV